MSGSSMLLAAAGAATVGAVALTTLTRSAETADRSDM